MSGPLSPLIHLIDDDLAVRESLALLIGSGPVFRHLRLLQRGWQYNSTREKRPLKLDQRTQCGFASWS